MSNRIFDAIRRRNAPDLIKALDAHRQLHTCSSISTSRYELNAGAANLGVDSIGRSPLVVATESGFLCVVEPLLKYLTELAPPVPPPLPTTSTESRAKLSAFQNSRRRPSISVIAAAQEEATRASAEQTERDRVEAERHKLSELCQINRALLSATTNGTVDLIEMMILSCQKLGADLNAAQEQSGYTSLHGVAAQGHVKAVTLLIRKLVKLSPVAKASGHTPLHLAAAAKRGSAASKIIFLLIINRAPMDPVDNDGLTPFHIAVLKRRRQAAQILADSGARIDTRDRAQGMTPLHDAIRCNFVAAWRDMLLPIADEEIGRDGAPIPAPVTVSETVDDADVQPVPVQAAPDADAMNDGTQNNDCDEPERDLEPPDDDDDDDADSSHDDDDNHSPFRKSAVTFAPSEPAPPPSKLFCLSDYVNWPNHAGVRPLEFAVLTGNARAVRRLIHCGADPALCVHPTTTDTLLHTAVRLGFYSIVKRLCQPLPVYRKMRRAAAADDAAATASLSPASVPAPLPERNLPPGQAAQPTPVGESNSGDAAPMLAAQHDDSGIAQHDPAENADADDGNALLADERPLAAIGSLVFDYKPPAESVPEPEPVVEMFVPAEDGFNNVKFPFLKCCNVLAQNAQGETALDVARYRRYDDDLSYQVAMELRAKRLRELEQEREQRKAQRHLEFIQQQQQQQQHQSQSQKGASAAVAAASAAVAAAVELEDAVSGARVSVTDAESLPLPALSEMQKIGDYLLKLVPKERKRQRKKDHLTKPSAAMVFSNEYERRLLMAHGAMDPSPSSSSSSDSDSDNAERQARITFSDDDEEEEEVVVETDDDGDL